MNDIVITGSTGVIGRRAVRELVAAGHRVTGVTRSARSPLVRVAPRSTAHMLYGALRATEIALRATVAIGTLRGMPAVVSATAAVALLGAAVVVGGLLGAFLGGAAVGAAVLAWATTRSRS